MNSKTKTFLDEHKFLASYKTEVKFNKSDGYPQKFNAVTTELVVKYSDVLKAIKMEMNTLSREIKSNRRLK